MTKNNNLLVDLGNSAAKWVQHEKGCASGQSTMLKQYYPKNISAAFFIDCWRSINKPERIIVSCVADDQIWQSLQEACEELWSLTAEKVSTVKKGFGLSNGYNEPTELGVDRWCGMIGASQETESDFIVADCGSAITVDVVTSSGQHLGGYILPGIAMMKKSLATDTADVHLKTEPTKVSLTPGNSMVGCVESGVHLAAVKLIESVYENQLQRNENVQCFITGGDAAVLSELLSVKCAMIPDLVIRGLAVIAKD